MAFLIFFLVWALILGLLYMEKIGKWAFIVGLVLAAVAGFGIQAAWIAWVLVLLGLVVGFLNVTAQESRGFLLAAIGFMLSATAVQSIPFVGEMVTRIILRPFPRARG